MISDLRNVKGFEWDHGNIEHIRKHEVKYKECEEVFTNKPLVINGDETHSQVEESLRVYGKTSKKRLLLMVFTVRNNKIRIVSARDQDRKERVEYKNKEVRMYEKT